MTIAGSLVFLFVLAAVFAGLVLLQIRLSGTGSRWPGLVLPAISLTVAVCATVANVLLNAAAVCTVTDAGGNCAQTSGSLAAIILAAVLVFLVWNIPTITFGGIYLYRRDRMRLRAELDRMSAQDL